MEETSDRLGRWFAIYDRNGEEIFSARLLHETGELQIAWTSSLRLAVMHVAAVQEHLGQQIDTVTGTASNGLEIAIRSEREFSDVFARRLGRFLGGRWTVSAARRSGVRNEVWDIIANRESQQ